MSTTPSQQSEPAEPVPAGESGEPTPVLGSQASVPRPIPQATTSYSRPPTLTHSSGSSGSSSPRASEAGSSSNASAHPLELPGRTSREAISRQPTPPLATDGASTPVDDSLATSRPVSRRSTPPPLESPVPLAATSGLLLGTSNAQGGMLSIAPPRRNFAAAPSMPSPLARPSIVPTRTSDDEDDDVLDADGDVETTSLEPAPDAAPPGDGRAVRMVTTKRRTSSAALLGTSPRALSPSALVHLFPGGRPPVPSSSSAVSAASSDAGSSPTGDLNALGLMTQMQSVRKERQLSDGSVGRSDTSSPSTSPNRVRRRSEFVGPLSPSGPVARYPSLSIPATSPGKHVSPLNPLPTPWSTGSQPSSSLSASPDTGAPIRLTRIPTSVQLAADLLSSSPATSSGPASASVKVPKTDMFAGLSLSAPQPMPHPTTAAASVSNLNLTPAPSRPASPGEFGILDSKMATPHPSPTSEEGDFSGSAPADPSSVDQLSASWLTSSSFAKSRTSPMPPFAPSSFAGTSLAGPGAASNHHRYRTSVHESTLANTSSSLRTSTSRASFHENANTLGGGQSTAEDLAEAHARHIVATRWAKRQTWGNAPTPVMPGNARSKSSSLLEAVDLTPSLERPFSDFGAPTDAPSLAQPAAPRDDLKWVNVDFSAEVQKLQAEKARKARADMDAFAMPLTTAQPAAAAPPVRFTESPLQTDWAAESPRPEQYSTSSQSSSPASGTPGAVAAKVGHRRSMSLRSSLGKAPFSLDAGKSSPQKITTLFAQPRAVSSSSTMSRESIDKPRRNISAKIDGWWKSVVGNIGNLNTSAAKTTAHTVSSHHLPLPKPTLPRLPPPVAGSNATSPPPTFGFSPATAPPAVVAATTDLKHATSLHQLTSPSPMPPPARPVRAQTDLAPAPEPREAAPRNSAETILRPYVPPEQSLDARRRQPALHLRLAQQQQASSAADSPSGSNSSAEQRGAALRPPLRPTISRTSSYGTTDDSPENSSRRLRTASAWGQSPGALYAVLPDDPNETPPLGYDEFAVTSRDFNKSAVNRQVKAKVSAEKKACDKRLNDIVHEISMFVERKLQEVNSRDDPEPTSALSSAMLSSALDSQSDFGGDDAERMDPPPVMRRRQSSRPASRRPSISLPQGSPARRLENLPPVEVRSPGRRRTSTAMSRPQPDYRISRQLGFNDDPISNASSRSTSRSRSPMPLAGPFQAADPPTTDEQTQLPNIFLDTIQATIDIATEVQETPVSQFMAKPGSCQEYVQKMIDIRNVWQEHSEWPGRDWYGSMLFAISTLARALEWWQEEKVFWDFNDESTENADPLTFVLRPPPKARSPAPPSSYRPPQAPLGVDLQHAGASAPAAVYPSVEEVLDMHAHDDGEKTATLPDAQPERRPSAEDGDVDLHTKAEQARMLNVVLELGLDGDFVEWVNPAWEKVVGLSVDQVIGQNLHQFLAPADVSMISDHSRALVESVDGHIAHARFRLQVVAKPVDVAPDREPGPVYELMEGTGMLVRDNGQPQHVMWVVKPIGSVYEESPVDEQPAGEGPPQTPKSGGLGFHRRSSTQPVTPFPTGGTISTQIVLCRICERDVPTWYFEKHSETCHEIHRLEADIGEQNDRVGEILKEAEALLAMYEPQERPATPTYRGTAVASRLQHALPLTPEAARAAQTAAQCNLIRHVVQNLQTCLEISTPSLKDETATLPIEEQLLLSPRSEEHMVAMSVWARPPTEDAALTRLIDDCLLVTRGKVNAVNRLRNTIIYSERVRREWQDKVEEQLAALSEESESNSSNESTSTSAGEEDEPAPAPPTNVERRPTASHLTVPGLQLEQPSRPPSFESQATTPSPTPLQASDLDVRRPHHRRRLSSRTDGTDMSTSPLFPSTSPAEASPTRLRKSSGRLSVYSDAPLSPRLPCVTPASRSTTISIKDFEIIKPISKGAFGSVYLAKKKTTGDHYAIKILKKSDMISKNQVTNVKAERKILMNQAESPYVVRLFFTFQNKHYLFLVMEYLPGGDLAALVKMLGTLGEDWTRRFIAEVILGLEALHSKGVVHRDLKPDNLLIDKDGHLKLTDFGLSKIGLLGRQAGGSRFVIPRGRARPGHQHGSRQDTQNQSIDSTDTPAFSPSSQASGSYAGFSQSSYFNDSRQSGGEESSGSEYAPRHRRPTQTASMGLGVSLNTALGLKSLVDTEHTPPISETHKFVGTVDYVAPESILGLGDDVSVDWWALGVVMYEFLYGVPPFNDESAEKVFANITSRKIFFPPDDDEMQTSPAARDLMERLLCVDPQRRLGARGADEIKDHPFFDGLDWDTLLTTPGPFVPQPTDDVSTDYFDARGLTDLPDELNPTLAAIAPGAAGATDPAIAALADDFGTFNFRNLSASKAANDDLLNKIKQEAEETQQLAMSEPTSAVLRHDRRKSSSAVRKRSRGPAWVDAKTALGNPPSPSTSTSSSASGPLSSAAFWPHHARRTSDMERVQADSDLSRRSSLPSRLRASSTSHQSLSEGSPLLLSPPSSVSSPHSPSHEASVSKVQALLADENRVSRQVAKNILTKLGIELAEASNGSDAVAIATTCPFDVIFVDASLRDITCDGVARYLKSVTGPNSETPIVGVIAHASDNVPLVSEQGTNFAAVLAKPVTKDGVRLILHKLGFIEGLAAAAVGAGGSNGGGA